MSQNSARADDLANVQYYLDELNGVGKVTYSTATAAEILAATNLAISNDPTPSADAAGYIAAVLAVRTDAATVAPSLVAGAITSSGADASTTASIVNSAATTLSGHTPVITAANLQKAYPLIASAAINANPSAVSNIVTTFTSGGSPFVPSTSAVAFAESSIAGIATNTTAVTSFVTDLLNSPIVSATSNNATKTGFPIVVAKAVSKNLAAAGAVIGGAAATSAFSGDAAKILLTGSAITAIPTATLYIADSVATSSTNTAAFATSVATGLAIASKGLVAAGVVEADLANNAGANATAIANQVIATDGTSTKLRINTPALLASFTESGITGLNGNAAPISTFMAAVVSNTDVNVSVTTGSATAFTITVAKAEAKNLVSVGAVVGGVASTSPFNGDSLKTTLANAVITAVPTAAATIADFVGLQISSLTTFASSLAPGRPVATQGLIAEGVIQASPGSAMSIFNSVLGANNGTSLAITSKLLPAFAATAASGVATNSAAVSAIALAAASASTPATPTGSPAPQTVANIDAIAAAIAAAAPSSAGAVANSILSNGPLFNTITSATNVLTFATGIAKAKGVVTVGSDVAAVANAVITASGTTVLKSGTSNAISVSVALINAATSSATAVTESVSTLVASGSAQVTYAQGVAAGVKSTYWGPLATGVILTNPSLSGEVARAVVTTGLAPGKTVAPATLTSVLGTIASSIPASYANDMALDISELMSTNVNHAGAAQIAISSAPAIAAAIANAPLVRASANEMGGVASNIAVMIPPTSTANITAIINVAVAVLKLSPNDDARAKQIAGDVARAAADFIFNNTYNAGSASLLGSTTTVGSFLYNLNAALQKITPSGIDPDITTAINQGSTNTGGYTFGSIDQHESPFQPD